LSLGINIRVKKPTDHALVLRVILSGFRLEELDVFAQSQRDLHAFLTKGQLDWRREKVGNYLRLA
jgi:hypothetical protein